MKSRIRHTFVTCPNVHALYACSVPSGWVGGWDGTRRAEDASAPRNVVRRDAGVDGGCPRGASRCRCAPNSGPVAEALRSWPGGSVVRPGPARRRPSPWKTGAAVKPDSWERVYRGSLIDVTVERWGDRRREVVEHPGAVAIVAVDSHDQLTLVRQLREPARKSLLELPAGTLETGEDPLTTARRELAEETGLFGGEWSELGRFYTTPGFCREYMHVYLAQRAQAGDSSPAGDEDLEVVRWPAPAVEERLAEIEDAKTLAGLLLYLRAR